MSKNNTKKCGECKHLEAVGLILKTTESYLTLTTCSNPESDHYKHILCEYEHTACDKIVILE